MRIIALLLPILLTATSNFIFAASPTPLCEYALWDPEKKWLIDFPIDPQFPMELPTGYVLSGNTKAVYFDKTPTPLFLQLNSQQPAIDANLENTRVRPATLFEGFQEIMEQIETPHYAPYWSASDHNNMRTENGIWLPGIEVALLSLGTSINAGGEYVTESYVIEDTITKNVVGLRQVIWDIEKNYYSTGGGIFAPFARKGHGNRSLKIIAAELAKRRPLRPLVVHVHKDNIPSIENVRKAGFIASPDFMDPEEPNLYAFEYPY